MSNKDTVEFRVVTYWNAACPELDKRTAGGHRCIHIAATWTVRSQITWAKICSSSPTLLIQFLTAKKLPTHVLGRGGLGRHETHGLMHTANHGATFVFWQTGQAGTHLVCTTRNCQNQFLLSLQDKGWKE